MRLTSSVFQNINSQANGGVFHIQNFGGKLEILKDSSGIKNTFTDIYAKNYGSLLYSVATDFQLQFSENEVLCRTQFVDYLTSYSLNSSFSQGGAFYIKDADKGVLSFGGSYQNCMTTTSGAVFYIENTFFSDHQSIFEYNSAQQGGAITSSSSNVTISYSVIRYNTAEDGGAFYIDNNGYITINNVSITNNYASFQGGAFHVIWSKFSLRLPLYLTIKNCTDLKMNYALVSGGFFRFSHQLANLIIQNCSIEKNNATKGGMFDIDDISNFEIYYSFFKSFKAQTSAFMHSISPNLNFTIHYSSFECQPWNELFDIENLLTKSDIFSTNIYVQYAQNISLLANNFTKCGPSVKGGVFNLKNTLMYDINSTFFYNSAQLGGVISSDGSQMYLNNTKISDNYAQLGGGISLESFSYLNAYKVLFQKNTGYSSAGALLVQTQSYFDLNLTQFLSNIASENSAIEVLKGSKTKNITISRSQFRQNSATKNTLSLMYSSTVINQTTFSNNLALERSKNIFCGFSNLYIFDSLFDQTYNIKAAQELKDQTQGTYIFLIFNVSMLVQNTKFLNGISRDGGAIYVQGDSSIRIESSVFEKNLAAKRGGAIYAQSFVKMVVSNQTQFKDNLAKTVGDDFYVGNTPNQLEIINSTLTNPLAKTSIYAEMITLKLQNVVIKDMYNNNSERGAALQCINCRQILINETSFSNVRSQKGGAIYIEEQDKNKKNTDQYLKYLIHRSSFSNAEAQIGGAIYANNPLYLTISNSTFTRNKAVRGNFDLSGSGGALYYTCDSQFNFKCSVDIINGTQFILNQASFQGGAIYWDELEPIIDKTTIYFNNSATYYGQNIACYAQILGLITEQEYKTYYEKFEKITNTSRLLENTTDTGVKVEAQIENQRSGGSLPTIYLAHIDKYGQIVASDFASKVKVSVNASKINDPKAQQFSPIVEGKNQFEAFAGMVQVANLSFVGRPGYTYTLLFSTDGIDMTKKSNQIYLANLSAPTIEFNLNVELRECEVGEEFTQTGKCQQCPEGSGFSIKKMTEPGKCEKCPSDKATCNGGANIGPKPGYWRKSNETSNFIACFTYSACLGMVPPENDPKGSCAEGYQGVLCADCKDGFSRTGEFECSVCPDSTQNILRILFILLAAIGFLVYLVRSTMSGAKDVNNVTSIYIKILMSHIQLVLLTASFNFQWPKIVQQFFDTSKPVATTTTQIFSFDCFLKNVRPNQDDSMASSDSQKQIRIIFQRLILFSLLPFILFLASSSFWYTYRCIKRGQIEVSNKLMSTLVILLFFIHPNIVQVMFFNFKCVDVDGDSRLQNDLEIICYNPQHSLFSFAVGVPSIIVWGLGIPMFALVLLIRVRNALDQFQTKEKFGFLFRGYRREYYFWEIVIMYRKISIIFISIFLGAFGIIAQALFVFVVLLIFLVVNSKKKPFSTTTLNDLETLSLATSIVSVYCGLFFIADKPQEWIQANPQYADGALSLNEASRFAFFGIIVTANAIFFAFWGYKMLHEAKTKFRNMLPTVYMYLCLCGNRQKLQDEIERHRIDETNQILKEDFFRQIKTMKKMYNKQELRLTPLNIQKFQKYTDRKALLRILGDKSSSQEIEEVNKKSKRQIRILQNNETKEVNLNFDSKKTKIYPEKDIRNIIYNFRREDEEELTDQDQIATENYQPVFLKIDKNLLEKGNFSQKDSEDFYDLSKYFNDQDNKQKRKNRKNSKRQKKQRTPSTALNGNTMEPQVTIERLTPQTNEIVIKVEETSNNTQADEFDRGVISLKAKRNDYTLKKFLSGQTQEIDENQIEEQYDFSSKMVRMTEDIKLQSRQDDQSIQIYKRKPLGKGLLQKNSRMKTLTNDEAKNKIRGSRMNLKEKKNKDNIERNFDSKSVNNWPLKILIADLEPKSPMNKSQKDQQELKESIKSDSLSEISLYDEENVDKIIAEEIRDYENLKVPTKNKRIRDSIDSFISSNSSPSNSDRSDQDHPSDRPQKSNLVNHQVPKIKELSSKNSDSNWTNEAQDSVINEITTKHKPTQSRFKY